MTEDVIPTRRWSKEVEMLESRAHIGQAEAAVPTATDEQQDMSARLAAAPASQHEVTTSADDQWIFDVAVKHESRGKELYGPITFSSTAIVDFVRDVEAELARRCRAQRTNKESSDLASIASPASPAAHPATGEEK